jgi:hypothetical protein
MPKAAVDLGLVAAELFLGTGLVPRERFRAAVGRSDSTLRRWERANLIVVRDVGTLRFVDLPATVARWRSKAGPE